VTNKKEEEEEEEEDDEVTGVVRKVEIIK